MKNIDTGLAQLHNCANHTLIHSLPKSFKSQNARNMKRRIHTCHSPPETDYDAIFTAMINFNDVLKQKGLLNNASWSDERVYQLAKEIQLLQPGKFNNIFFDMVVFIWKICSYGNLLSGEISRN